MPLGKGTYVQGYYQSHVCYQVSVLWACGQGVWRLFSCVIQLLGSNARFLTRTSCDCFPFPANVTHGRRSAWLLFSSTPPHCKSEVH